MEWDNKKIFPELSLVIPCLNESETLASCINKAQLAFKNQHLQGEIIVADNGSTDGSQEIAERSGARVVQVEKKGYGAALMGGIAAARGEYVIMGDADDSYDFTQIHPFVEKLRQGYDLVMGCRFPKGGGKIMPGAMPWIHRWFGNPLLSAIGRLFFKPPVTDLYCGLRGFRRDSYQKMNLKITEWEFAYEMIIKATFMGMKIGEVPIVLHKDGRSRPSHLNTWRDGWRTLRFMLLYSPRWLFLIPGCILLTIGLVFGGILLKGPLIIGAVTFDTSTLLVAAMSVLVGFQLIVFSVFAKIFGISEGLLPYDPRFDRLAHHWTLEAGVLFGLLISLMGLGLLVWGVIYWKQHGFGHLSYPESLRLVIPGVTALTLGVEAIFSSFLIGLLGLRRR